MSALWLKLTTFLCLLFTSLSAPETSGVKRKSMGGSITVQCSCSVPAQESLELRKGLNQEVQVLYHDAKTQKDTIFKEFQTRIQVHAVFPKVDILIKNLTSDDTGPYWCVYKKFNESSLVMKMTKGSGSVLLVVEGDRKGDPVTGCNPSNDNLVMVSVVISAAVLLCIIMGVFLWLVKAKTTNSRKKPRRLPTNDVYEDMRGTLRR